MLVYDCFAHDRATFEAALKEDGAMLVLDLKQFEVVVRDGILMLQRKGADRALAMSVPFASARIFRPRRELAPPYCASAADHTKSTLVGFGGTG
jgi:hypothetical protein